MCGIAGIVSIDGRSTPAFELFNGQFAIGHQGRVVFASEVKAIFHALSLRFEDAEYDKTAAHDYRPRQRESCDRCKGCQ